MEEITLKQLNISLDLFLTKIKADLRQGVQIDSSNQEHTQLTKVWTDSKDWQFVVIGLSKTKDIETTSAVEIQSTGQSKMFIKIEVKFEKENLLLNFRKLGLAFAQTEMVSVEEAGEFLEAYIVSTFNRTLTSELFNELAHDKNYFNWLNH